MPLGTLVSVGEGLHQVLALLGERGETGRGLCLGAPRPVGLAAVGGAAHLGGHLVQRQVESAHLVVGCGFGPDHRALGEGGAAPHGRRGRA